MLSALLIAVTLAQPTPQDPTSAIKTLLTQQAADWNRGDVEAFATGYKNSPDILFIGPSTRHGYAAMLAGYKARYSTRQAMGTLTFDHLEVHLLDAHIATTTGNFHLTRTTAGGGDLRGYFLLVLEKTDCGWKTSATTRQPHPGRSSATHNRGTTHWQSSRHCCYEGSEQPYQEVVLLVKAIDPPRRSTVPRLPVTRPISTKPAKTFSSS